MLNKALVQEAIKMAHEGASTRDLPIYLFVSPDDFTSWFDYGKRLVDEGFGRDSVDDLQQEPEIDDFDILCLLLYKGVMTARWAIKKEMHRLVSESDNPNLALKYLEAVFFTDFDPKYAETETDTSEEDESAVSFVMEHFFENKNPKDVYNEDDGKFADETQDTEQETQEQDKA